MSHPRPLFRYYWRAINSNQKYVKGYITAPNKVLARRSLHQKNLKVYWLIRISITPPKRVSLKEILEFLRQLVLLLNAGIPLLSAFETLQLNEYKFPMEILIQQVKHHIQEGYSLANSLRQHMSNNVIFCSLIEAAEQSGMLIPIILKLTRYQEQIQNIENKLKSILIYPSIICFITFFISVLLLYQVIPKFITLFNQLGAPLPWITQCCIKLSQILQQYGGISFVILIVFILGVRYLFKILTPIREQLDLWKWTSIPIWSRLYNHSLTARFCFILALVIHAGIPLLEALRLIAPTTGNAYFRKTILMISEQIREGLSFTQALKINHLFPPSIQQMIAIGEESGKLEAMLLHVAKQQEETFFNLALYYTRLLEPCLMILIALWIGAFIIAMYLPIFYLGAAF